MNPVAEFLLRGALTLLFVALFGALVLGIRDAMRKRRFRKNLTAGLSE